MTVVLATPMRLGDLAERFGGLVDAEAVDRVVLAVAPVHAAGRPDLAPLTSLRYLDRAVASGAVLLVESSLASRCPVGVRWVHSHAGWVLASVLSELTATASTEQGQNETPRSTSHISCLAQVHPSVRVAEGAVVLAGASIGASSRIEPNAVVYGGVHIGARVTIGACAVIGRAGFGWVHAPDGLLCRMPQLGGVVVEDDVEIGPLCSIDAGTLSPTLVRRGAKLDAQVHVGHNSELGEWVIVAAQSGFAGSVRIGERTLVGGQTGVADHVIVGPGARLAAKSGVIGDVPAGRTVAGYPAVDRIRWLRAMARLLYSDRRSK